MHGYPVALDLKPPKCNTGLVFVNVVRCKTGLIFVNVDMFTLYSIYH